jgi:hypothetical protein
MRRYWRFDFLETRYAETKIFATIKNLQKFKFIFLSLTYFDTFKEINE